jgi:hypothetical protein
MKNIKRIVDDLKNSLDDPNFEAFIAEQINSSKNSSEKGPCFSISNKDIVLDVWKQGNNYSVVKSVIPGSFVKKTGKDFKKEMKKNELIEEILKTVKSFLD